MATSALLRHYLEYLTSPGTLLALAVIAGPIIFSFSIEKIQTIQSRGPDVPKGCRRLGFTKKSNLDRQFQPPTQTQHNRPIVKALFTYPIKSCRGVELQASEVGSSGLRYDRLFAFAQRVSATGKAASEHPDATRWRFITQREFPKLALLQTELWVPDPRIPRLHADGKVTNPSGRTRGATLVGQLEKGSNDTRPSQGYDWAAQGGCLVVRCPYSPSFNPFGWFTWPMTLVLPLAPTANRIQTKGYTFENLSIWQDSPQAINMTNEIPAKDVQRLALFLGVTKPLALFRVDDSHQQAVTRCLPPDVPREEFKTGFADAFPVNMLGLASVRALDEELPTDASAKGRLDARRFRANVYIAGTAAFAEDTWIRITLGRRIGRNADGLFECDAEYHVACPTTRCTLPNVDPESGVKDNNEPSTTLRRTRMVYKQAFPYPCLGMQTIPLFERGILRVGDEVRVLEKGEHDYEKMVY